MQVEFEIHHLVDRPGGLAGIVARDPAGHGFAEMLSSGANGVGLVVGTRIADTPGQAYRQAGASVRLDGAGDDHATLRGFERPNLTFQHESSQLIDGVIAIEDEPKRMLLRHGLVVLDTLRHVAETALHAADAPLLSLQCPAQLPPTNSFQESADVGGRRVDPARSASIAIRFRIALDRPRADVRLQIADRLARHCEDRGLGFWLGDTRPGYRTGNWFLVHPHNRKLARGRYRRDADLHRAGNAADGCLPVTFVGPARPGTTHAILSFLGQYPQIGVLGCSMTPLDELAFLNVQLAVSGASRARLAAVNGDIADLRATSDGLAEALPRIVAAVLPAGAEPIGPPTREHTERLVGRAGDYQLVAGPALPVVPDSDVRRIPIWISWQMRKVLDAQLTRPVPRGLGRRQPQPVHRAVQGEQRYPEPGLGPWSAGGSGCPCCAGGGRWPWRSRWSRAGRGTSATARRSCLLTSRVPGGRSCRRPVTTTWSAASRCRRASSCWVGTSRSCRRAAELVPGRDPCDGDGSVAPSALVSRSDRSPRDARRGRAGHLGRDERRARPHRPPRLPTGRAHAAVTGAVVPVLVQQHFRHTGVAEDELDERISADTAGPAHQSRPRRRRTALDPGAAVDAVPSMCFLPPVVIAPIGRGSTRWTITPTFRRCACFVDTAPTATPARRSSTSATPTTCSSSGSRRPSPPGWSPPDRMSARGRSSTAYRAGCCRRFADARRSWPQRVDERALPRQRSRGVPPRDPAGVRGPYRWLGLPAMARR